MNTDKIIAESIAKDYAPKESSKIVALKSPQCQIGHIKLSPAHASSGKYNYF